MKFPNSTICIFVAFISMFIIKDAVGQAVFEISTEKREMSKGNQMGYMIDIPESDLDMVTKNWIKLLQSETKEKVAVTDHEIMIEGSMDKEIVQKPINIYSFVYVVDTAVRVYSFFEIDSTFFEYSGDKTDIAGEKMYNGIANFMRKFAANQYIDAVNAEMELEMDIFKSLQNDLKKLEKDHENFNKEIKENEQNIAEANDEIEMLNADNERLLGSISAQRTEIAAITDEEIKKAAKKELKSLESDKKKVSNKIEKEQKNIVEYESAITSCHDQIAKNLELQEEKKMDIIIQEELIKNVSAKLDGIK